MRCPHCSHEFDFTIGRYISSHFGPHVCPRCGEASKLDFNLNYFLISLVPSIAISAASTYYWTNKLHGDYLGPLYGFGIALPIILIWDYIWDRSIRSLEIFPAQKGFRVMVTHVPEPTDEGTTEDKTDAPKSPGAERPGIKVTKFLGYAPGARPKTMPIVKPPVARNPTTTVLASKKPVAPVTVAKIGPAGPTKGKAAKGLFGQTSKAKPASKSVEAEVTETAPPSEQPEEQSIAEHVAEHVTEHAVTEIHPEAVSAAEHPEHAEAGVHSEHSAVAEQPESLEHSVHAEHQTVAEQPEQLEVIEHYPPTDQAFHTEYTEVAEHSPDVEPAVNLEPVEGAEHAENFEQPSHEPVASEIQADPDTHVDPELTIAESPTASHPDPATSAWVAPEEVELAPAPANLPAQVLPPDESYSYDPEAVKTTVLPKKVKA